MEVREEGIRPAADTTDNFHAVVSTNDHGSITSIDGITFANGYRRDYSVLFCSMFLCRLVRPPPPAPSALSKRGVKAAVKLHPGGVYCTPEILVLETVSLAAQSTPLRMVDKVLYTQNQSPILDRWRLCIKL